MFRKNKRHLQSPLFSDLDHLSQKARTRLENSWAGTFRQDFFVRLEETPFAVLYSGEPSRPNIPINVLVGLESLKAGFGWSDEEMQDAFLYDVQVRYAVGYENLGEGEFDLRSVYNFRQRVSEHMRQTGENLIERAFHQVTDEQIAAYQIKTGRLRMDSTQIASNMRRMSRLQLLVEMLQRTFRMLTEEDQRRYREAFGLYVQDTSGHFIYRLNTGEAAAHFQAIGELMQRLLVALAPAYAEQKIYHLLQRVYAENYVEEVGDPPPKEPVETQGPSSGEPGEPSPQGAPDPPVRLVKPIPGSEISPGRLRSPDDPEASYRKKGAQVYEGYAVNLTDTCDPANPFQLIVKVQTEANQKEDPDFLLEALPDLQARTDLESLFTDAGFCSPQVDHTLSPLRITQIPSAMRGIAADPEHIHLSDFQLHFDDQDQLTHLTCPHGEHFPVEPGRKEGRYIARLAAQICADCSSRKHRDTRTDRPKAKPTLRFSQVDIARALRRQRCQAYQASQQSLRAAIEAAIGALKRPFSDDQVPVRGKFRVGNLMIGSAILVNIRRIQRYRIEKSQPKKAERRASHSSRSPERSAPVAKPSLLSLLRSLFRPLLPTSWAANMTFSFGF